MKLLEDFGVRALFGTLLILGALAIAVGGTLTGKVDANTALTVSSGWAMAVIGFYFGARATQNSIEKK